MATTDNYKFKKSKLGHPVRDDDIGENLDIIDTELKRVEDTVPPSSVLLLDEEE